MSTMVLFVLAGLTGLMGLGFAGFSFSSAYRLRYHFLYASTNYTKFIQGFAYVFSFLLLVKVLHNIYESHLRLVSQSFCISHIMFWLCSSTRVWDSFVISQIFFNDFFLFV
jgi:hypothetical protein